ncbi:MAG: hypothetical protein ACLQFR_20350 [Streptosporangiaceae bacterium]
MATVPGTPFGVAAAPAGRWAFVGLGGQVGVVRTGGQRIPALVRHVTIQPTSQAVAMLGDTTTPDGRYLLAADARSGAVVLSTRAAEDGRAHAVLGALTGPPGPGGAIEVAVSPDGRYAFVSLEDAEKIAVFSLQRAIADGFGPADYIGSIPTQVAPVGLAFSPDGRWLYSTSEVSGLPSPVGSLSVIDVAKAETDPAHSVVSRVLAGCNPVRVITSPDGSTVWVTARASDALLAFSASRLRADPRHALLAAVRVGEAPVGLALVRGGTRIVVADSNRFAAGGAVASLALVDTAAALAGKPALLGYLPAGRFPREMALEPGGKVLLVTNFASGQLEAVNVASLP